MGCDKRIGTKATSDYDKRTTQTPGETRQHTVFVFVTPRRWRHKARWLRGKQALGDWLDVKAIDTDDLEQWLENRPAVALAFSEELGESGPGVESVGRYWDAWRSQSQPKITGDALLTGRTDVASGLLARLRRALAEQAVPETLVVRGDSVDEAVAFICAVTTSDERLGGRTAVVTAGSGWRYIERQTDVRIAVIAHHEAARTRSPRERLLTIIPASLTSPRSRQDDDPIELKRPLANDFLQALIDIGVEPSDATRQARSCGRSWSVWRRRQATNPSIRHPHWLERPEARRLGLLCLLDDWDEKREFDRAAISRIAGADYGDIERDLFTLASLDDAPVLHIGSVWKAKAPLELLELYGERLTRSEIERFLSFGEELLNTPDPRMELPVDHRYMAALHGKTPPYSERLIESVVTTLAKLAARGDELPSLAALDIADRVSNTVANVLRDADATRWLSLSHHLPDLAEAAPDAFLSAVEYDLRQPYPSLEALFSDTMGDPLFGRTYHTGLLWALERLAWAPRWFPRVALILARLTRFSLPENLGNRPSRSLRGLFDPDRPQTTADIADRLAVIDSVLRQIPDAGYELVAEMISGDLRLGAHSVSPRWRDYDAGTAIRPDPVEIRGFMVDISDRRFALSSGEPERIASLIEDIPFRATDLVDRAIALAEPFTTEAADDNARNILRRSLRKQLHWYRNHGDDESADLATSIAALDQLYERLAPTDPVTRDLWLFADHWVEPHVRVQDATAEDTGLRIADLRADALQEVMSTQGWDGLERLARECRAPMVVGLTLGEFRIGSIDWIDKLRARSEDAILTRDAALRALISGLLRGLPTDQVIEILSAAVESHWSTERRVDLFALARVERPIWQLAQTFGTEVFNGYWQTVSADGLYIRDDGERDEALRYLLTVGRPGAALSVCRFAIKRTDPALLLDIATAALSDDSPDFSKLDRWHWNELIERVESDQNIDQRRLFQLEAAIVPSLDSTLERRTKPRLIFRELMTNPTMFAQLVSWVYKRDDGSEGDADNVDDLTFERALKLLEACGVPPGTDADGVTNADEFHEFIASALDECTRLWRQKKGEFVLGEILAYAPADPDDRWPNGMVCEVLDRPEADEMRRGFKRGIFAKRGVTSRGIYDGGEQERALAGQFTRDAERLRSKFPRVSRMLDQISHDYLTESRHHDIDADLTMEDGP